MPSRLFPRRRTMDDFPKAQDETDVCVCVDVTSTRCSNQMWKRETASSRRGETLLLFFIIKKDDVTVTSGCCFQLVVSVAASLNRWLVPIGQLKLWASISKLRWGHRKWRGRYTVRLHELRASYRVCQWLAVTVHSWRSGAIGSSSWYRLRDAACCCCDAHGHDTRDVSFVTSSSFFFFWWWWCHTFTSVFLLLLLINYVFSDFNGTEFLILFLKHWNCFHLFTNVEL